MLTKLIEKKEIAEGTMAFSFEKPEGFSHKAGQNLDVTLINPSETDEEGNSRTFSVITSPQDGHIAVATRMRDTAFKRVLKGMESGTEVEISDPMGSFVLHNDTSKPAIFLIGGIGITPVHSILVDAAERQLSHQLVLFYSNRRPEDAAFLEELTALQAKNPNYKFIPTMTEMDKSKQPWNGETGYITRELIEKYVPAGTAAVWYLSGPQVMVKSMRDILTAMKIDDDYIRTEEFSGY